MPITDIRREAVKDVLSRQWDGKGEDKQLAETVAEQIKICWDGASERELVDIWDSYNRAFGLSDDIIEEVPLEAAAVPATTGAGLSLEAIVGDGWFGRYLEWTSEHEAPAVFHFGAALAGIAAGLGRAPRIQWEARATYPNLYVLLIGPTGARKGSAIERAVNLTAMVFETNLLPTEGTHQGFAWALRQRQGKTEQWSDGFIVAPEYSVLARKDRNKEGLIQWLTDWYDCPRDWSRVLKGEGVVQLQDVCVNMLGASNVAWLHTLPEDAVTGGFLPRHLVFTAHGPRHRKAWPRFNDKLEQELIDHLVKVQMDERPKVIEVESSASKFIEAWYEVDVARQYQKHESEQFRAWLDRKQAALIKVAAVWQLLDRGPRDAITIEWATKAQRLVDWLDPMVLETYGELGTTDEGRCAQRCLSFIERRGGAATQATIVRALRNKHKKGNIIEALETLRSSKEIDVDKESTKGIVWRVRE